MEQTNEIISEKFDAIKKTIDDTIYSFLKGRINYEEITPEKHLIDDLQAESIEILEIVMALSVEFNISILKNDVFGFKNINDIYHFVYDEVDE